MKVKSLPGLLVLVVVLELAALVGLGVQNISQAREIKNLKNSTASKADLDANARLLNGAITTDFALERPVVDAQASVIYLPEFRVRLPLDNISKTLAYSMRNEGKDPAEADVTSTSYLPPEKQTVIACSDLVRLKLEAKPNPYSPHEKATSVILSDGRVLQVYELNGVTECQNSWDISISPATVAAIFKNATSY